MLTSFLLSLSSISLFLSLQILLRQLLQLLTIQNLLDALGLVLHILQHVVQDSGVLSHKKSTYVRFLNYLGASSSSSKVFAQISELDCLLALPLQMSMLLVYSSNQERYSARLESLRLTPELRYSCTLLGLPLLNFEPANLTSTSLTSGEISSSIFWNSSTSFFFLSTYSWIFILLFSSSGVSFKIFCFSQLSFLSCSFLALRFWLISTRLSISWLRTSTQVKRLQFCYSPLMKVFWISRISVNPVASLMVVKASSMTFMFLWQLSISFTFSLLLTINLVSLCFKTAAVSFWMALISPVLILLPLLSLGSLSSLLSSVSLLQQLVLSSSFFIFRLSIKFWLILLVFWLDSMFCMRLLISESAFSISPSSDFRLFWYMVFSCLSRLMAPFNLAISPMVSLYRLSFQVRWMGYDIYLFLQISHLGEHHLHFSLLALLLELGHVLLQFLNISVQFGLNALEGQQIPSLPLVFLGVVIRLLLHFLGLVDASP